MKLVFVTQALDSADPALGVTPALVRALAQRFDHVSVLALRVGDADLPENVTVRGFGAPTRIGRAVRFVAALRAELRSSPDAVLAHMSPVYAIAAAPLARPRGIPVLLWFTHWRRSIRLRIAESVCTALLTVEPGSVPLRSPKIRAIGHGIDVGEFACVDRSARGAPLRAIAIGRTSPAKGLETVVEGVRLARAAGVDVELELRGPSLTAEERSHRDALGVVQPPVPRTEVPALLAHADVLVNNMRAGAPDKVVFEACATCLPVLASNPSFDGLLDDELRFDRESPAQLADRLAWLAAMSAAGRAEIGRRLRNRVEAGHSVDHWADAVADVVRQRT